MTTKQLLIIIAPIVVVVVIVAYLVITANPKPAEEEVVVEEQTGTLPETEEDGFVSKEEFGVKKRTIFNPSAELPLFSNIIDVTSEAATLSYDADSILYFDPQVGDFYSVSLIGTDPERESQELFFNVRDIDWAPDKTTIGLVFFDAGNKEYSAYLHDLDKKSGKSLGDYIQEMIFYNKGQSVFYKYVNLDEDEQLYKTARSTGGNGQVFDATVQGNSQLVWAQGLDLVSIASLPRYNNKASLSLLDSSAYGNGYVISPQDGLLGLDVSWSPDSGQVFYSAVSIANNSVVNGIRNAETREDMTVNLKTFANKCVWSYGSEYIYCGVPSNTSERSFPPDEYYEKKMYTSDGVWRINSETGAAELVYNLVSEEGVSMDITEPFLLDDASVMYFTNRRDDKVYAVNLRKILGDEAEEE